MSFGSVSHKDDLRKTILRHFSGLELTQILTASREFPVTSRVDVQKGLESLLEKYGGTRLFGIHSQMMSHETQTFAHLLSDNPYAPTFGPLQHDEVDVGDDLPVRCLKNGLWLARTSDFAFAVVMSPATRYGQNAGVHVEVVVPAGEPGAEFTQELLKALESYVAAGRTYRGRVLSLEMFQDPTGKGGGVKVHRLHKVRREDVILPPATLALLDRNILRFVASRDRLKDLHFSGKKGLLFYGPPGTGKTHTIHYLSSQLPGHTTFLITAEQVGLIGEYFRLARFLQPSMMVIEDVDLIARDREHMGSPVEEVLLNKLLNEMDGLRADADVLFILTTNRPDQLEPALAARPGRIDQAIEFPLPDEEGRKKLIALYSGGLNVPAEVESLLIRKTNGASPAFIKELLRRCAQFQIDLGGDDVLRMEAVDGAIEEMVFTGGSLNVKLLGGSAADLKTSAGLKP